MNKTVMGINGMTFVWKDNKSIGVTKAMTETKSLAFLQIRNRNTDIL